MLYSNVDLTIIITLGNDDHVLHTVRQVKVGEGAATSCPHVLTLPSLQICAHRFFGPTIFPCITLHQVYFNYIMSCCELYSVDL